jgi:hypothetical protein
MGIHQSQIDDLVLATQDKLIQKGAFVDMQTDLTDHVAVREMWQKKTKQFEGGLDWTFQIQMDHNHSARTVGLYEQDASSIHDTLVEGKVGPRHVNAHYLYDLREPSFQRGGLEVTNLVKTRYTGMIVSLFELLEPMLWGKPVDSSDKKTPYGIGYWVTRSASEGFNGGDPVGFTDGRAGLSTTVYPRFANWTAQYASVSKEDLVRKMRKAHRNIQFRSPVSHANPTLSMGNGIYTNDAVIGTLEEILEAQNMNLGNDLASKDGRVVFKSTPVQYVPALNDDSADPIYMLDWKWLVIGVLAGWYKNLTKPYMVPGKHNVRRVDLDASLNMVCTDPRRQAVICK